MNSLEKYKTTELNQKRFQRRYRKETTYTNFVDADHKKKLAQRNLYHAIRENAENSELIKKVLDLRSAIILFYDRRNEMRESKNYKRYINTGGDIANIKAEISKEEQSE